MAQFIDVAGSPPDIRLRIERQLFGKRWWFYLVVPEFVWGELREFGSCDPNAAYLCDKIFWDKLAENNADILAWRASADARRRTLERSLDSEDFGWLSGSFRQYVRGSVY